MPGTVMPVANEREALLAFLAQQRHVLKIAAYGLTEQQARATPSASVLSVGGLVKHVASTEEGWIDIVLLRPRPHEEGMRRYEEDFRLQPGEMLADILERYDRVAKRTESVIAGISDLCQAVPVPKDVPWFPSDVQAWSVRWVLQHLIQETARHAGHADIVRESVDGATAYELMAAAEGWPASPWMKPWSPSGADGGTP